MNISTTAKAKKRTSVFLNGKHLLEKNKKNLKKVLTKHTQSAIIKSRDKEIHLNSNNYYTSI